MKQLTWIAILLFICAGFTCGKSSKPTVNTNSRPLPTEEPTPVVELPTPTPFIPPIIRPRPTPYPTPVIDITPLLAPREYDIKVIVDAEPDADLGALINEASKTLDEIVSSGAIYVNGGGAIKTTPVIRHDIYFDDNTYSCETKSIMYGCFLLDNKVRVMGVIGKTVILGPSYNEPGNPVINVFQTLASTKEGSHANPSNDIGIVGIIVKDRQSMTDGGVRQTFSLGNTNNCYALYNEIYDAASIGIQVGGSSEREHRAKNCVIAFNKVHGSAAAAFAMVNGEDIDFFANEVKRPGRKGGGVTGIDIEPNIATDYAKNIRLFNNLIDFTDAAFSGVGNAIAAQNPERVENTTGLLIANNIILGGPPDSMHTGLSNGLFFTNFFKGAIVATNLIETAKQAGIQLTGSIAATFQDNVISSSGGGGIPAVFISGGNSNNFVRNVIGDLPDNQVNTAPIIVYSDDSTGNTFTGNTAPAVSMTEFKKMMGTL